MSGRSHAYALPTTFLSHPMKSSNHHDKPDFSRHFHRCTMVLPHRSTLQNKLFTRIYRHGKSSCLLENQPHSNRTTNLVGYSRSPGKKYAKNGELLINYDWKALKQKKQGIFGYGYSDTLSPIQGYRHPWTLTQNEFKIVYEEFKLHMTPNGVVPDNRFRIPSLLTQVSTIITASNIAGDLTRQAIGITRMFPIVKLFTTSVTLVGWGQSILDAIEKQKFSEELKSLSSSYEKERIFRDGGY